MKNSELRRKTPLKPSRPKQRRRAISEASKEQRQKVEKNPVCIACERPRAALNAIDPAHLVDRSHGGCDDPRCVIPLCRTCHERYDRHELDLTPHLEPRYREEAAHAVSHVGIVTAYQRLTGERLAA